MKKYKNFRIHETDNGYAVQGQRVTDLNWETTHNFTDRQEALKSLLNVAHGTSVKFRCEIGAYNEGGYGVSFINGEAQPTTRFK